MTSGDAPTPIRLPEKPRALCLTSPCFNFEASQPALPANPEPKMIAVSLSGVKDGVETRKELR
jgi:hypothetical protein